MRRGVKIKSAACTLAVLASCISPVIAADQTTECRAVQNEASLTWPDKLVFSMASDESKRFCHFFVSLPPPSATRPAVDAWFNSSTGSLDVKSALRSIIGIALEPIPKDSRYYKFVPEVIEKGEPLVAACTVALYNNVPFKQATKDGVLACNVFPSRSLLFLSVSFADKFHSAVTLPRPSFLK